jgi:SPP1 family predicted phage head-tail adaptor
MNSGKMKDRIMFESHAEYSSQKDTLGGCADNWLPFKSTSDTSETGTTTTNIKMTTHGMANGDYIVNSSRSNAVRQVTVVDANNVTVTAVTGQSSGDTILKFIATDSKVWGTLIPTNAGKQYIDGKNTMYVTHKIEVRYRSDLTKKMRIKLVNDNNRILKILSMINVKNENKTWLIECSEVG